MRHNILIVLVLATACSNKATPSAPAVPPKSLEAAAAAPAESGLTGKVAEKIDASQYSYLRLETKSGEVWAAVPKSRIEVGAQVTIVGAIWMTDFTSATLSRTWSRIAFGTIQGESQEPPGMASQGAAAGRSPAGMFAREAAGMVPAAQAAPAPAADAVEPALKKVAAREGRTIAEIYAQKAALKDQKVAVRGKVVKEVDGVMGKNWLHLRDGTGSGASADLAVASLGTAHVGDVVVMTGTVHLDRDLGAGYRYDVLVEDAQVQKE